MPISCWSALLAHAQAYKQSYLMSDPGNRAQRSVNVYVSFYSSSSLLFEKLSRVNQTHQAFFAILLCTHSRCGFRFRFRFRFLLFCLLSLQFGNFFLELDLFRPQAITSLLQLDHSFRRCGFLNPLRSLCNKSTPNMGYAYRRADLSDILLCFQICAIPCSCCSDGGN